MPIERKKADDGLTEPRQKRQKDFHCTSCNRDFVADSFYNSYSILFRGNAGKMCICKQCIEDLYNTLYKDYNDVEFSVFRICQLLDVYYDTGLAKASEIQASNTNTNVIKIYFQKINSLPQYRGKTFANSPTQHMKIKGSIEQNDFDKMSEEDIANMNEVVNLVGYDPFIDAGIDEKPYLYNTIINYLDESTLNDSFKLSAVIEITRMFSQIDMMNKIITSITKDVDNLEAQSGKLKQLISIKKDLTTQIMQYAKENGITTNKQDSASKGSGTVSGMLKELRDKKIRPSDANLFDISSSQAFRKVADISNQSIANQLQFDENDYTKMIKMQREKIKEFRDLYEQMQEENRLIKKENEFLKIELNKKDDK